MKFSFKKTEFTQVYIQGFSAKHSVCVSLKSNVQKTFVKLIYF